MSAATASIADVPGTAFTNKDDSRDRRTSVTGQSQAQCPARPLPALGTQTIIQGNGTTVGTIISLQCPAKHKLVGKELMCVMDTNGPRWVGDTYCKPVSPFGAHGFHVAVLASIVSLAIIFFLSVAFITCCLLDCMKQDKRKNHERESEMWQWEEQDQDQGDSSYSDKGRNNNNNNTQDKGQNLWHTRNPDMCDNMPACRCHQQYAYGPTPPLSTLPGYGYDRPLLPRGPGAAQISGPPEYNGPPLSRQTTNPGPVQVSAAGPLLVRQYGVQQSGLPGRIPSPTDESSARNVKSAKEFSIRIISV